MSDFASQFIARLMKDRVSTQGFFSPYQHPTNHPTQVVYPRMKSTHSSDGFLVVGAEKITFDYRNLLHTEIYTSSDAGVTIWVVDADRREEDGYFSYHTHIFVVPGQGHIDRLSEYKIYYDPYLQVYRVSMFEELRFPRRRRYEDAPDLSSRCTNTQSLNTSSQVVKVGPVDLSPSKPFNWADDVEDEQGPIAAPGDFSPPGSDSIPTSPAEKTDNESWRTKGSSAEYQAQKLPDLTLSQTSNILEKTLYTPITQIADESTELVITAGPTLLERPRAHAPSVQSQKYRNIRLVQVLDLEGQGTESSSSMVADRLRGLDLHGHKEVELGTRACSQLPKDPSLSKASVTNGKGPAISGPSFQSWESKIERMLNEMPLDEVEEMTSSIPASPSATVETGALQLVPSISSTSPQIEMERGSAAGTLVTNKGPNLQQYVTPISRDQYERLLEKWVPNYEDYGNECMIDIEHRWFCMHQKTLSDRENGSYVPKRLEERDRKKDLFILYGNSVPVSGVIQPEISRKDWFWDGDQFPVKYPFTPVTSPPLHHVNAYSRPVFHRTSTPPEISMWAWSHVACPPPYSPTSLKTALLNSACATIDPVGYTGGLPLEDLYGKEMIDVLRGHCKIFYYPNGSWMSDVYREGDNRPGELLSTPKDIAAAHAETMANNNAQTRYEDLDSIWGGSERTESDVAESPSVQKLESAEAHPPVHDLPTGRAKPSNLRFYSEVEQPTISSTRSGITDPEMLQDEPDWGNLSTKATHGLGGDLNSMASNRLVDAIARDNAEVATEKDDLDELDSTNSTKQYKPYEGDAEANIGTENFATNEEEADSFGHEQIGKAAAVNEPTITESSSSQTTEEATPDSSLGSEGEEESVCLEDRVVNRSSGATTVETSTPSLGDDSEVILAEDLENRLSRILGTPDSAQARMSSPLTESDTSSTMTALERFELRMSSSQALVLHRKSAQEACVSAIEGLVYYHGLVAKTGFDRVTTLSALECLRSWNLSSISQIVYYELYKLGVPPAKSIIGCFNSHMAGSRAMVLYSPTTVQTKLRENISIGCERDGLIGGKMAPEIGGEWIEVLSLLDNVGVEFDLKVKSLGKDMQIAREHDSSGALNFPLLMVFFGVLFLCAIFRS
ncbi:MAG: hypothetical protein M1836_007653 [Candelina mexicana]|nr:MAG: hypothetical protein M1836_007653 [Candelina mexicana]